ncbi:Acyl carrier protein [Fusarium oxysporum f. sp. albedinis]|nr:Acyl carrier protein [Fusarium oxysporum f. sp. albedinis]
MTTGVQTAGTDFGFAQPGSSQLRPEKREGLTCRPDYRSRDTINPTYGPGLGLSWHKGAHRPSQSIPRDGFRVCCFCGGDAQWRIPLATKIPVPLILILAIFSVPFSSRWPYAIKELFPMRYFHRTLMAAFIVSQSQLSGASLLVSGIYGFMGVIGTIIYLGIVADRWPRARTLWTGSLALSVSIAICMALSATYGQAGESNMAGARASITFIFIYSATFAIFFNTMIWVVPSELFPTFLRSKGTAFAVSSKSVVAIVLSQITPLALAEVSWRFYALFIACNTAASVLYFFFLPETGGKTLEEISELFGDAVAVGMHANIKKLDATSVVHAEGSEPRK